MRPPSAHGASIAENTASWVSLAMTALKRDEIEFLTDASGAPALWRQDLAGNVVDAPPGALVWRRLLRRLPRPRR